MKHLVFILTLVCAGLSWAEPEWVRGEVVEPPLKGQITLKHEAIKSVRMGAMTMPFLVDERVSLKGFKVGDQVRFTVRVDGHYLKIDQLKQTK
jgi:Cu/Ag efflux protein CusF